MDNPFAVELLEKLKQFPTALDWCNIAVPLTKIPMNVFVLEENTLGIDMMMLGELGRLFKALWSKVRIKSEGDDDATHFAKVYQATTCALIFCPDCYSAWNDRKDVINYLLDASPDGEQTYKMQVVLKNEFDFINLLFTKFGKATNAWYHRKWVGMKYLELIDWSDADEHRVMMMSHEDDVRLIMNWAEKEFAVCAKVIEKFPKNYYAYTNKLHVVRELCAIIDKEYIIEALDRLIIRLVLKEIDWANGWLKMNVTDHSAVNFHHQCCTIYYKLRSVNAEERQKHIGENIKKAKVMSGIYGSLGMGNDAIYRWRRLCAVSFLQYCEEADDEMKDIFVKMLEDNNERNMSKEEKRHFFGYIAWVARHAREAKEGFNIGAQRMETILAGEKVALANLTSVEVQQINHFWDCLKVEKTK